LLGAILAGNFDIRAFDAVATVLRAVKTGAITTSQWFALATRGFSARDVSTASERSLYIFQFPAITGRLIY
jgi:hypothetical protein